MTVRERPPDPPLAVFWCFVLTFSGATWVSWFGMTVISSPDNALSISTYLASFLCCVYHALIAGIGFFVAISKTDPKGVTDLTTAGTLHALGSMVIFFVVGFVLLMLVDEKAGIEAAREGSPLEPERE